MPLKNISAEDLYWLALNAYREARGEILSGQIAVSHVVLNRAEKKNKSPKQIILAPAQFSWTMEDNAFQRPISEPLRFLACLESVEQCLKKREDGYTLFGADHYFNPSKVNPKWAAKMTHIITLGNHSFYKEK